jgi:hypothetical protein
MQKLARLGIQGWTYSPASIYHISMVLHTHTNGVLPSDRSTALATPRIPLETYLLEEIGIRNFSNIVPLIDFGDFKEE